jgi:hypothetical protein
MGSTNKGLIAVCLTPLLVSNVLPGIFCPQLETLTIPSQRDRTQAGEVVGLVNSMACRQGGDGDSRSLGGI